jgi:subtilisin family serine protease
MRTKYLLLFVIIIAVRSGLAQDLSKMNFRLAKKSQNKEFPDQSISVFIKGDIPKLRADIDQMGGRLNYAAGDIASVSLPIKNLSLLAGKNYVKRMEARPSRIQLTSDSMRIKANVNPVYLGQAPLTRGYDGTGVVVGIIDTGIDYTNPDFKDSLTGKTRLKFLWDQNLATAANTPPVYGYGQEWDSIQINAGQAESTNASQFNHGTNSTGIAAGNGNHSPGHKYRGVAPKADIIVVALNFNSTSATIITDAVDYIYTKAQAMAEPCVINLSLGDYYGSHDGQDLQAQMMNNMLIAQSGRAMVASAGNDGGQYIHLGYNLSAADTNFTWFQLGTDSLIELWADTNMFKNASMSIGADNIAQGYSSRGNTKYISVADNRGIIREDTIFSPSGNRIAIVESNTAIQGNTFDITFYVVPDSGMYNYNWRLSLTGSGAFDLWADSMIYTGLPSVHDFSAITFYKKPDTLQTILTSFQCLDNVITVGNYDNKKTYIDALGIRVEPFPYMQAGKIERNSSIGPTRDGRLKPDIAAPGSLTMASSELTLVAFYDSVVPTFVEYDGYMRAGGTSASSPVVAGVAALYLQKYPAATASEVRHAIIACPITDNFTGSVPNNIWGYGKVDAFAALTSCLSGINPLKPPIPKLVLYPNPFTEQTNIEYDFTAEGNYSSAQLKIYDLLGKLARTINLTEKFARITLDRGDLESGSYIYTLLIDGKMVQSDKLLVL